ncbi:testis-expressed protein 101 [Neophocaena asiaeorientalis asiaeorientalis]|uniref:Testis-expressed protein 101 n=1 Tax=Neophocaena asiaeorientalis asiaeorientalis TaxID=1706337 RepID=A0A341DB86_NEOAA|nr:testis-expressed protein 101 [Neophocaena asiaeorientalis asiaeorientalis]
MWLKSFFSIKSQILIANVSKRSHGSLSFPGFTVPLSPRSPDLDLYVLGMWRESSWVTEDGFLVKKEWFGAPQRRACAYLYLIFSPVAQNLRCQKSTFVGLEADPVETFNWTTDKAETCDNGALCQETVLMIKAGTRTAILATKGCTSDGAPAITFIQHTPAPGLVAVSYSNYCEDSFCNNKEDLHELWRTEEIDAPRGSTDLRCPTCLALGSCLNAPSLSCPNDTNQCYQGKLQVTGGDLSAPLEIKGCTSADGCRLMSGIFTVGPLWVKETCPLRSVSPRKVESGATWLHTSVWRLELLLLLSLQALVH